MSRRLAKPTGGAASSSEPMPEPVLVDDDTQAAAEQNERDLALFEWHEAATRDEERRQEQRQVEAMAGWSVKPGPKRLKLEVAALAVSVFPVRAP